MQNNSMARHRVIPSDKQHRPKPRVQEVILISSLIAEDTVHQETLCVQQVDISVSALIYWLMLTVAKVPRTGICAWLVLVKSLGSLLSLAVRCRFRLPDSVFNALFKIQLSIESQICLRLGLLQSLCDCESWIRSCFPFNSCQGKGGRLCGVLYRSIICHLKLIELCWDKYITKAELRCGSYRNDFFMSIEIVGKELRFLSVRIRNICKI